MLCHGVRVRLVLFAAGLVMGWGVTGWAGDAAPPRDAEDLQQQMAPVLAYLDAPAYAAVTPLAEHIVLAYQLAQDRPPTPEEFLVAEDLCLYRGLPRSGVLSLALRGGDAATSWEQCRAFLQRHDQSSFHSNASIRAAANELAATARWNAAKSMRLEEQPPSPFPLPKAETEPATPNEVYNVYFGYCHAHTSLSDGQGTPMQAYTHARDEGHLDYFALTDHGEFLVVWPWENKWGQLREAADATDEPGRFAALWGFEWGNPVMGHVNVLNTEEFTDVLENWSLQQLYRWLARRPEAVGLFNHPGDYDALGTEFLRFQRFDGAVPAMAGVEVANEDTGFGRYYYDGSWNSDLSYWDVANRNGWWTGPAIGQDNHKPDWGTRNPARTAVLAKELTREAIVDAYRQRRFYATEDSDLFLDFRCDGYPMGARLADTPRNFTVSAHDGSGAAFESVRLYRDGVLLETRPVTGAVVEERFTDTAYYANAYYYVIVTTAEDADGNGRNDDAISAPIWITAIVPGLSACKPACGPASAKQDHSPQAERGDVGLTTLFLAALFLSGRRARRSIK